MRQASYVPAELLLVYPHERTTHVGAVFLGGNVHMVLIETPLRCGLEEEEIGQQVYGLAGDACTKYTQYNTSYPGATGQGTCDVKNKLYVIHLSAKMTPLFHEFSLEGTTIHSYPY